MFKTVRVLLVAAFLLLGLAACSPVTAEVSYPPPVDMITPTPSPTQTMTVIDPSLILTPMPLTQTLTPAQATSNAPRPTQDAYCYQPPEFLLPISDAQELNEDQIAKKLMELFLAYYHAPQASNECRIEEYRIDDVYYDERYASLPLDPKGDFMRAVLYSVKPPLIDNHPYGFWGVLVTLGIDDWYHAGANVAVFRHDNGYTMQFAGP